MLGTLAPDKLVPSPDSVPDRFETGTPAFELMAGAVAAVDHLAGLDDAATGSRRDRVLASMGAVQRYEAAVLSRLESGLRSDAARVRAGFGHRTGPRPSRSRSRAGNRAR